MSSLNTIQICDESRSKKKSISCKHFHLHYPQVYSFLDSRFLSFIHYLFIINVFIKHTLSFILSLLNTHNPSFTNHSIDIILHLFIIKHKLSYLYLLFISTHHPSFIHYDLISLSLSQDK